MSFQASSHPSDMSASDLEAATAVAPRPDLLQHLVEISRETFGFYTSHYPHTINYPWAAAKLETLPLGSRLLDIGAGVTPVPLFLAKRGMFVECVDKNHLIRTLPTKPDWNEWGFFDYGTVHPNLSAYNRDITEFSPRAPFDAIYGISSMAHMPRIVREATLRRCWDWLRPGGRLLLAIDLIPASDFLWNRSEGVQVEPPIQHGTVGSVVSQLWDLQFQVSEFRVVRAVYRSRTDLSFIDCHKTAQTSIPEGNFCEARQ